MVTGPTLSQFWIPRNHVQNKDKFLSVFTHPVVHGYTVGKRVHGARALHKKSPFCTKIKCSAQKRPAGALVLGKSLKESAATLLRDGKVFAEFRIDKADFNIAAPQKARKMVFKLAFR